MFEQTTQDVGTVVLSNLDAAYRLARWHFRTEREAESVVRDASDRAFREFTTFSIDTGRVWFLRMVSRICAERNAQRTRFEPTAGGRHDRAGSTSRDHRKCVDDVTQLEEAIRTLPPDLREVLVLRELEGLSYQELADLMGAPLETVTVMLSRSRQALGHALTEVLVAAEA
jgi:RNA polymerase sigma-70 factor, ECF subfamily